MRRSAETEFSATDFRNALGNPENREEIAEFVGEENVDAVLDILGLSTVEEVSMGVGGYGAPLAFGSVDDPEDKKEAKKRKEY